MVLVVDLPGPLRAALSVLTLVVGSTWASGSAASQTSLRASEDSVKAAYLLHFGSYVVWPEEAFTGAESPLTIGVLEADEVVGALREIVDGRRVEGHPVEVLRLGPGDSVDNVHILYVGKAVGRRLAETLDRGRESGALLVTETDGALELGSSINFVTLDSRVRFDISLASADEAGLRFSARLLGVARRVVSGSGR